MRKKGIRNLTKRKEKVASVEEYNDYDNFVNFQYNCCLSHGGEVTWHTLIGEERKGIQVQIATCASLSRRRQPLRNILLMPYILTNIVDVDIITIKLFYEVCHVHLTSTHVIINNLYFCKHQIYRGRCVVVMLCYGLIFLVVYTKEGDLPIRKIFLLMETNDYVQLTKVEWKGYDNTKDEDGLDQ